MDKYSRVDGPANSHHQGYMRGPWDEASEVRGMAKRRYPLSEVRGGDERSYPASEVRGGGGRILWKE